MVDNTQSNYPKRDGGRKWWTITYQTTWKVIVDNTLSNYPKGDAAQLDRRQVQDDPQPDCCHLDEEEAVAAALPGFYIFFKSNYRVSQKTHFQNAVGATVHWLNHK